MWIFTRTGFVSAVQDWNDPNMVFVRARDADSLTSLSQATAATITPSPPADYPYRVHITKVAFADWVRSQAELIDYPNFKSEVATTRGEEYAHALMDVWSTMHAVEDDAARHAPTMTASTTEPARRDPWEAHWRYPDFVINRIREPYPEGAPVAPGSTPVVSFGNPGTAEVATLAINASYDEFEFKSCDVLAKRGHPRRLVDLGTLGLTTTEEMSVAQASDVADACYGYFENTIVHPWFKLMQTHVLDPIGVSYRDGSACHLDVVQWSTKPIWKGVAAGVKKALISTDRVFLADQVADASFDVILVNGRSALTVVRSLVGFEEISVEQAPQTTAEMVVGKIGTTKVLGWSPFLQSSYTTPPTRDAVLHWLKQQS